MALIRTGSNEKIKSMVFSCGYMQLKEAVTKVTLSFGFLVNHSDDTFREMLAFKDSDTLSYAFVEKDNNIVLHIIYEDQRAFRKKGRLFVEEIYKCICRLVPARRTQNGNS